MVTNPYFSKMYYSLGTFEAGKQNRMFILDGIFVGCDTMVKEEIVMG